MNTIDIRIINKDSNWKELEWFIDDIRLSEHLCNKKIIELSEKEESFDDLCPAWTKELDYSGDVKFVWYLIGLEKAILPIYMCPDDLDFSCTVVVVEVEKTNNSVHWKRAGYVVEPDYDFQIEKKCGILFTEAYTEEDWDKYGDNIALAECGSDEWHQWIAENWEEELFRRRINYTYANYQKEGNILWFADLNFEFDRVEYDAMVKKYQEQEIIL